MTVHLPFSNWKNLSPQLQSRSKGQAEWEAGTRIPRTLVPRPGCPKHQFASLRNHSGELCSPFHSRENKAPNLSPLSVENLSFRRPHSRGARPGPSPSSMVNGPLESSKNWVPWILKALLETLDPMVCAVTLNLGHFTAPTHPRKPPDS